MISLVRKLNFNYFKLDKKYKLDQQVESAKEEWKRARKYFNSVSDPDLVDHAIYLLEATEIKYSYLLKKKKLKNQE